MNKLSFNIMFMKIAVLHLLLSLFIIRAGSATICAQYGDLRLVGGTTAFEGRVEVCDGMGSGGWNYRVCSDRWDDNDAMVVCRQLGFSQVDSTAVKGQEVRQFQNSNATQFLLNEVNCYGIEPRLINCSFNFQYPHVNCDGSGVEDAGVRCTNTSLIENVTASYSDTTVRLTWNPVYNRVINNFKIKCFYVHDNTTHVAQSMVFRDTLSVQLNGLAPSTPYNCCVSAMLEKFSSTMCTQVNTSASEDSTSTSCANGSEIAVGMLAFFNIAILVSLVLAAVALVYSVFIIRKQKKQLHTRNAKFFQLETETNPSYLTGNDAKREFNENRQVVNTKRNFDGKDDSVKRRNCYQETRRGSPKETMLSSLKSGGGMQSKDTAIQPKQNSNENLEMNPSYSTVPIAGVGEYALIGPLYEKTDQKSKLSVSLKVKAGDKWINRASPKAKSFTSSSHIRQRDRFNNKSSEGFHQMQIEGNPAYHTLPSTDNEYSPVGPAYVKANKACDEITKHEYAEIKEEKTESLDNDLQDKHKSSDHRLSGLASGVRKDKDNTNAVHCNDPAVISPAKSECDKKTDDKAAEEGHAATAIGINEDESEYY